MAEEADKGNSDGNSRTVIVAKGGTVNASKADSTEKANPPAETEVVEMPKPGGPGEVKKLENSSDPAPVADETDSELGDPSPDLAFEEEEEDDDGPRLQTYTPSSMLVKGQFDVKYFQQIYSQTRFFSPSGDAVDQGNRSTYYSGIFNFVAGYSKRWNFGVDAWMQSVLIDDEETSPFKILTFPSGNNARTALTAIGPKVKYQPFSKANGFTIQSSFLFPIAKDPEGRMNGRPFLATQNFLWWTQFFYTWNIAERWQLFTELDFYWNIDRSFDFSQSGFVATPASAFLSFFPTDKVTVYWMNQFWPTLGEGVFSSHWYQMGVGGKYQFSKSLDIEVSYGRFLFGQSAAGPARTFNLGLRFVKW